MRGEDGPFAQNGECALCGHVERPSVLGTVENVLFHLVITMQRSTMSDFPTSSAGITGGLVGLGAGDSPLHSVPLSEGTSMPGSR